MEKSSKDHDNISIKGPINLKAENNKIIVEFGEDKKPQPPKKEAPGIKILLYFLAITLLMIAVIDGGIGFQPSSRPAHQPSHPFPR